MKINYKLLESLIYNEVKHYLNEGMFEDEDSDKDDDYDTDYEDEDDEGTDDNESDTDDENDNNPSKGKPGVAFSDDESEKKKEAIKYKLKAIIPVLIHSEESGINSFNITRSQIAYAIYKDLDKDAARSKLSQKLNGRKKFTTTEINNIFEIISHIST